jgi:hypothetical protein
MAAAHLPRLVNMGEIGRRQKNQPAPPHAVFEAITESDRDPARPWLILEHDEVLPTVLDASRPDYVVWSSLWPSRPDARLRFDLPPDAGGQGTDLRWTLVVDDPEPDGSKIGYMRKRVNELINANLRYSFCQ